MAKTPAVYLDNAATSWPKPPEVIEAISGFYRDEGRAAGRGSYGGAIRSERIIDDCRDEIRRFIGASNKASIVFAGNGTDALNMAIHGVLHRGDHVVATTIEHTSVLRPLHDESVRNDVEYTLVPAGENGIVVADDIDRSIRSNTRLVCINHVSNVSGIIQDVRTIGTICRRRNVLLLIDASQSLGHVDINLGDTECDLLAAAGHKGLMGPLGTGILVVGPRAADVIRPIRQGGSGGNSESMSPPADLPERLECGNLNVAGIAGLCAGLRFVSATGVANVAAHEKLLGNLLARRLEQNSRIRIIGSRAASQTGITSFHVDDYDSHELAVILDSGFGIEVRAGLHCAPYAATGDTSLPTLPTVRVSPGWYNTGEEIERLCDAVLEILD